MWAQASEKKSFSFLFCILVSRLRLTQVDTVNTVGSLHFGPQSIFERYPAFEYRCLYENGGAEPSIEMYFRETADRIWRQIHIKYETGRETSSIITWHQPVNMKWKGKWFLLLMHVYSKYVDNLDQKFQGISGEPFERLKSTSPFLWHKPSIYKLKRIEFLR